jgi:adenylosuccinate synthase
MPITLVVGMQTGDEGKGKIVDILAELAVMGFRFQGGANAGHTVVLPDGTKIKLNLTPSCVDRENILLGYGAGMVADPIKLITEWKMLESAGYSVRDRAIIDEGLKVTTPMTRAMDFADEFYREHILGEEIVGTTGRGIGPTYGDEIFKDPIVFGMFARDKDAFAKKIRRHCDEKLRFIKHVKQVDDASFIEFFRIIDETEKKANQKLIDTGVISSDDISYTRFCDSSKIKFNEDEVIDALWETGTEFRENIGDLSLIVHNMLLKGERLVGEGAQGRVIDKRWGYSPNVTLSHTIASELSAGIGVSMDHVDRIVGVLKAYSTKVGVHEFVSEIDPEKYSDISEKLMGVEFGTTTGRQRKVGWIDLPELRRSQTVNGCDEIAIQKLDMLAGHEKLLICDYYVDQTGEEFYTAPRSNEELRGMKAHYKEMKGFSNITGCTDWNQLPAEAKQYIAEIVKSIQEVNPKKELKLGYIGTGPQRDNIIKNAPAVKEIIKEYCTQDL